ncbi:MAG: sugar ABC transporter permease [Chloroflexi bacterium]|nr:sugar ABC transporter permease [Chloroflexota bacterium]
MSFRRRSNAFREARDFYLFVLPWFLGFLAFTVGPIASSVFLSLTKYNIIRPASWVGLQNYQELFADPLFGVSLYNTLYYVVFAVPLSVAVALLLALFLNQRLRGISIYRTLFYVPSIVPAVASIVLWVWILQPQFGLINSGLRFLGIQGPLWLGSPEWSKPSMVLMHAWSSGGAMIIFLAGLQGVPEHLYEAAAIDGANWWARFWNVTVPMLTPTIFFVLVLGIINSFQVFTAAFIMTGGGPVDSTLFYVLYLYRHGFTFLNMGYAAAMAWILFIIILGFTLVQFALARRWVYYEGGR